MDAPLSRDAGRRSDFVQSLDRGLAVMRAFSAERPRLTLTEVAREAGITRAAARRFLLTLVDLGYVASNGREFSLRPRVLELGYAYLSSMTLPEIAQPHLEALVEKVRESSSIAVLDGDHVVDIMRVRGPGILVVAVPVGTRFPVHASSKGRVLLANLPPDELNRRLSSLRFPRLTSRTVVNKARFRAILAEVREQGYALADQELEDGLRSIAVPIRDGAGTAIAGANISAYASRVTVDDMIGRILPNLRAAVAEIEADLRALGLRQSTVPRHAAVRAGTPA
ncbi:MAG TPA: IclR family transcriptional regulator C-terminal domain-containing protein [Actinomycetota bacterium]|jgi:IclR family pca regulon transcriptional regulator